VTATFGLAAFCIAVACSAPASAQRRPGPKPPLTCTEVRALVSRIETGDTGAIDDTRTLLPRLLPDQATRDRYFEGYSGVSLDDRAVHAYELVHLLAALLSAADRCGGSGAHVRAREAMLLALDVCLLASQLRPPLHRPGFSSWDLSTSYVHVTQVCGEMALWEVERSLKRLARTDRVYRERLAQANRHVAAAARVSGSRTRQLMPYLSRMDVRSQAEFRRISAVQWREVAFRLRSARRSLAACTAGSAHKARTEP
jgi:hypothetical protein